MKSYQSEYIKWESKKKNNPGINKPWSTFFRADDSNFSYLNKDNDIYQTLKKNVIYALSDL